MTPNPCAKMRKIDNPYETWKSSNGTWTWLVLKKWQADDNKPHARWFCAVSSPSTFGGHDLGDVYVSEIKKYAQKVEKHQEDDVLGMDEDDLKAVMNDAGKRHVVTVDITKQVGEALEKAGFGSDSNNEKDITKAGMWDLLDSLIGKGRFAVDSAKAELERRGV
jgi:hypothetical protein